MLPFAGSEYLIGSAIAGAAAGLFGITDVVPHGGPIVGVLGATNNLLMFLAAIIIGTVVGALLLVALKRSADAKKLSSLERTAVSWQRCPSTFL